MKREVVKSVVWALLVAVLLGLTIVVGSRNLFRFDSALVAYTFASLFAAFGLTYRSPCGFNGVLPTTMLAPVNPGPGEGALDVEDRENFHP